MALLRLLFGLVMLWCVPLAHADDLQLAEQEIKAGLLYNFLKYTDWPKRSLSSPMITVCIFGGDPFDGRLQPMAGRTVNRREIVIRFVHAVSDVKDCQVLFLNSNQSGRWPEIHAFLKGVNVLTVSDYSGFAEAGGMIEFGHRNDHISAALNMDAVSAAHLSIEERMLRLVMVVHPGEAAP